MDNAYLKLNEIEYVLYLSEGTVRKITNDENIENVFVYSQDDWDRLKQGYSTGSSMGVDVIAVSP